MFDDMLHTIGICIILIALVQGFGLIPVTFAYCVFVLITTIIELIKIWRNND